MKAGLVSVLVLFVLGLAASAAGGESIRPLSAECETALALSAAPVNVREKAGVYLLRDTGFELSHPSGNGFHCLVERNHADSVIPQCFDAASLEANLAVILDESRLLREGQSFAELRERRRQALAEGAYPTAGPGLVYMVSDYNYIYNPRRDALLKVAPHMMFHAPNLTNDDIGSKMSVALANRGLPFINAQGPHGFMIGFTEMGSGTADVERVCKGQLPDPAGMIPFPPQR